jgi:ABC-type nitrate/sulfonate/bicarbonate transport system permease component
MRLARKSRTLALELLVPVVLIALWWYLSRNSTSPYFPPLEDSWQEFKDVYIWTGIREDVIAVSLKHFVVGFVLGVAVGFALGLLIGLSDRARRNLSPLTEFFRATPIVALIPAAMIMVGPGMALEAGLIALGSNWAVMLNTADGVRSVDPVTLDSARAYGLSRSQQIRKVIIPAAMPQVLAGVQVAVALGIAVMVVANMFVATQGLGARVVEAQVNFNPKGSWAGIFMIGIIGLLITVIYNVIHNRLLAWHRGWRGTAGAN